MYRIALWSMLLSRLTGCSAIIGLEDVTHGEEKRRIGVQVRGLWEGSSGVALRLEADGINTLLTAFNGDSHFERVLDIGTSYAVTVAADPAQHSCVIEAGGNGVVSDADILTVSIACRVPEVMIALSGLWGWTFDSTQDTQRFAGSIAAQDVAFTVSGSRLTGASVGGIAAALGTKTTPIALPLGSSIVPIELTASGGLSKTYQLVFDRGGSVLEQVVYGKTSNPEAGDTLGFSAELSGDTLVVSAIFEDSAASGVNGNQADNSAGNAGAVYVFARTGTTWAQQAYLKASNPETGDEFGRSVAVSGDTLVVGATSEDSAASGVNGNQSDNSAVNAGAAYVFVRTGTTWAQQAYLKASNPGTGDQFGRSVALSGDTLVVGANGNDGTVYVFVRTGTTWTQQAYLKASNPEAGDQFGFPVTLFGDTLAVGAHREDSGVNGNPADNSAVWAGAVYVFVRTGTTWTQQAYLKASNPGAGDWFGFSVALSGDTLVVGAVGEDSAASGINGNSADNSTENAGAVYVFVRTGTTWTQQAYIKASNPGVGDWFGASVALSGDTLAIGAIGEASATAGVNGHQADNSMEGAGAVYVFLCMGAWTQQAYVKASNPGAGDHFGYSVALFGNTLAVGAIYEASGASGVNGNQADNNADSAGAVYVYR